jgi:hypothetical protein
MVARFFLLPKMTSAHRHVQPPTRPRVKVILSEEGVGPAPGKPAREGYMLPTRSEHCME